jgi:type VI secretion system protein ImpF
VARSELERTVQQPLLDRLVDHDPDERHEPAMTWAQSVRQLKMSVHRDLEWLLNTRRTPEPAPEEFEELRHSLYEYGLPDITSMSRDSAGERQRLLRRVEEAIEIFEPRLTAVRVSLVEGEEETRREVHFLIEGMLRLDPNPEPVVFDTVLEVSSGEYKVKGTGGGTPGA